MPKIPTKWTKLLIPLWAVFSGCSSIPKPHTDLCVANAGALQSKCYWIDQDYDDNGNLKPGAVANYKTLKVTSDIDKAIWTDPDGWANLKAYLKILETELQNCQKKQ